MNTNSTTTRNASGERAPQAAQQLQNLPFPPPPGGYGTRALRVSLKVSVISEQGLATQAQGRTVWE